MPYTINFTRTALAQVQALNQPFQGQILKKIERLRNRATWPPVKGLQPPFAGMRIRSGDYRILFDVDEAAEIVTIAEIKKRGRAYRVT